MFFSTNNLPLAVTPFVSSNFSAFISPLPCSDVYSCLWIDVDVYSHGVCRESSCGTLNSAGLSCPMILLFWNLFPALWYYVQAWICFFLLSCVFICLQQNLLVGWPVRSPQEVVANPLTRPISRPWKSLQLLTREVKCQMTTSKAKNNQKKQPVGCWSLELWTVIGKLSYFHSAELKLDWCVYFIIVRVVTKLNTAVNDFEVFQGSVVSELVTQFWFDWRLLHMVLRLQTLRSWCGLCFTTSLSLHRALADTTVSIDNAVCLWWVLHFCVILFWRIMW